jgi:transcription initiation factor IIE alpha subunit
MVFDMRDKLCSDFIEMAMEIERIYGMPLVLDDEHEVVGYHCPHCGEPVYFEDWIDDYFGGQDMDMCPICEEVLEVN